MRRFVLLAVAVLVVSPFARAADPVPTAAELKDIKQLSEDIFGLATRQQACAKLGTTGRRRGRRSRT